jgi:hypothetical protein
MALVKVYDLDGIEHEKESVDARECCREMGWSLTPPGEPQPPEPEEVKDRFADMSVAELKGWLDQNNKPYPNLVRKSELLTLCRGE